MTASQFPHARRVPIDSNHPIQGRKEVITMMTVEIIEKRLDSGVLIRYFRSIGYNGSQAVCRSSLTDPRGK
jgi:hypothetical protein